jgi:hypothetical protein
MTNKIHAEPLAIFYVAKWKGLQSQNSILSTEVWNLLLIWKKMI